MSTHTPPLSLDELERIRRECRSMVTSRAGLSAGASVLPLPGADIGADVALLLEMIPAINRKFGLTPEQIDQLDPHVRTVILVTVTSIGSELIGKLITKKLVLLAMKKLGGRLAGKSVARFVPFVGQAIAASISFGAMRMLGNAHIDDCYAVARQGLLALEQKPA